MEKSPAALGTVINVRLSPSGVELRLTKSTGGDDWIATKDDSDVLVEFKEGKVLTRPNSLLCHSGLGGGNTAIVELVGAKWSGGASTGAAKCLLCQHTIDDQVWERF